MNIHQTKKSTWRFIHNFQWNLLRIIDPQKYKQMAEFDDFNFDTSSDEGESEGFTPDDVIKAIEKGAQLRHVLIHVNTMNLNRHVLIHVNTMSLNRHVLIHVNSMNHIFLQIYVQIKTCRCMSPLSEKNISKRMGSSCLTCVLSFCLFEQ